MLSRFSIRFVIAVFGGAAVGLLVGVVARYLVGADWNVFAAMPWGIMAAALGLAFWQLRGETKGTERQKGR
ncbi:hypothetical protein [uncultured Friedmanniella sp.]|uniref:hypothetical protein n=1 Tax=uncultured Friedmanniella sp. TaxID=335381 RepID=UPI0035C94C22